MNTSLKKVIGIILLGVLVLATISALIQSRRGKILQQEVADTRRELREHGFKTDLADFNFHTDAAMQARASALIIFGYKSPGDIQNESVDLMSRVADDAVSVVWNQDWLKVGSQTIQWADLNQSLETNRLLLDIACAAALSGPIRFDLEAGRGGGMTLKHLPPLEQLARSFNHRLLVELHDGHFDLAWTNLLAATRLVTAWEPEPDEISHKERFTLTALAFAATWQALQAHQFSDAQLDRLQTEWQSVNFFTNLAETVAFARASGAVSIQRTRLQPIPARFSLAGLLQDPLKSPRLAWANLMFYDNFLRYRVHDSYVDEKNLLLFDSHLESELRVAYRASNWLQMRSMPGVMTNAPYSSPLRPRPPAYNNIVEIAEAMMDHGTSFIARAAEAEARRDILLTALALERYRLVYGFYPFTLDGLPDNFKKTAPMDFMDGRPLRYQFTSDGHFVLYSVGLDCMDDGGKLPLPNAPRIPKGSNGYELVPTNVDLVWPRPATP
jgi:hypothetical protein